MYEALRIDGNPNESGHTVTTGVPNGSAPEISYETVCVVGNGSFGRLPSDGVQTGDTVAIKKVLQDKRFKNRELQIMRVLDHTNVVKLKHCFYSTNEKEEVYLNLVLEFVPDTVYRISKHYSNRRSACPRCTSSFTRIRWRALANIHSGVCHRDIKPQNLLVNTLTHQLKLCDFGSAKILVRSEPNISYICSRYYRAPELIFGATDYTTAIDIWSLGCVMAELLLGQPLFPRRVRRGSARGDHQGAGHPDARGDPRHEPELHRVQIPANQGAPVEQGVPQASEPGRAGSHLAPVGVLPGGEVHGVEACAHAYFDELRDPGTRLPNGRPLPPLRLHRSGTARVHAGDGGETGAAARAGRGIVGGGGAVAGGD